MKPVSIPFNTVETTLHQRFEEIASRLPDCIAVTYQHHVLTYRQLNEAANRLSYKINEILGPNQSNIAFLLENSHHQIIAILSILKAGKSYVPLDTSFPFMRNLSMLENAACSLIISNELNKEQAKHLLEGRDLLLADKEYSSYPERNPEIYVSPEDLAILLYTSGSTGTPKGVMQSHLNMVHFIKRFTDITPVNAADIVAYYLSVGFSAHALPLFMALLNGSHLAIFNVKSDNFSGFIKWFQERKLTYAMMNPSFLRHLIASMEKKEVLYNLQYLVLGGETLYRSDVEKARNFLTQQAKVVNIYASTESYVTRAFVMEHHTILKGNIVPIGYPIQDMEISIVDQEGNVVEKEAGQICIKSAYITKGYWNNPELTSDDMIPDPNNSNIIIHKTTDLGYYLDKDCMVHIGRKDSFIKLRGFRIDLAEIENMLMDDEDVKEAVCLLRKSPQELEHIIAYVVKARKNPLNLDLIKAKAVRILPDYMIPKYFIELESLPKNDVGKIDYKAIPDPDWKILQGSRGEIKPRNSLEKELVAIFEAILKIKPIGVTDNFLKIGADSLSLFVVFSKIEKKHGAKLNINSITDNPTIENIAEYIGKKIYS